METLVNWRSDGNGPESLLDILISDGGGEPVDIEGGDVALLDRLGLSTVGQDPAALLPRRIPRYGMGQIVSGGGMVIPFHMRT